MTDVVITITGTAPHTIEIRAF